MHNQRLSTWCWWWCLLCVSCDVCDVLSGCAHTTMPTTLPLQMVSLLRFFNNSNKGSANCTHVSRHVSVFHVSKMHSLSIECLPWSHSSSHCRDEPQKLNCSDTLGLRRTTRALTFCFSINKSNSDRVFGRCRCMVITSSRVFDITIQSCFLRCVSMHVLLDNRVGSFSSTSNPNDLE